MLKDLDCPFDVLINNKYGTCHCMGVNASECEKDVEEEMTHSNSKYKR